MQALGLETPCLGPSPVISGLTSVPLCSSECSGQDCALGYEKEPWEVLQQGGEYQSCLWASVVVKASLGLAWER